MSKRERSLSLGFFLIFLALGWTIHNWLAGFLGVEAKNYGLSFGWGSEVVTALSLACLIGLTAWWWKKNSDLFLILIGGWINLIDRLVYGYVRDYWQFGLVYNNLADWIIGLGVAWFILNLWKQNQK